MKKILLILVMIFVGVCGCGKGKHILKPEPAIGYYPLNVGSFWEYYGKSRWSEYSLRREIVGFRVIPGSIGVYKVRYFKTYTSFFYPDTVEQKDEWFTYQTHIDNEIREFSDLNDPGAYEILLRFPLEVGSSWQEPPQQMDSVWVVPIFIDSVVAVEKVTTPAGDFDDCYRIREIFPVVDGLRYDGSERWFKPQVGFVKYWNEIGWLEYFLVDYKIMR